MLLSKLAISDTSSMSLLHCSLLFDPKSLTEKNRTNLWRNIHTHPVTLWWITRKMHLSVALIKRVMC